ncbi:hypothetical protein GOP47_0005682 [Adiantum capillus-veneris]|uniref:F-box domain-containing protein n=1 Tax=Adiantum capillus-veneris TaxID=13818 RepID=A0A9D4V5U4_ADICA|nr:hypothetical protein GOP47_0005682 [Adiantum capillus-veneris]
MEAREEEMEQPCWADMLPEALAKIFSFLPLHDLLHSIPFICSAWRKASLDAACWTHVDLSLWCCGKDTQTYSKMLSLVLNRSRGTLQQIVAPNLIKDSMLQMIACSGQSLQALQIRNSALSEDCLCQLAPRFTALTYLDIRGRSFSSRALVEAYGKHCPSIKKLALDIVEIRGGVGATSIARIMPRLTHLELCGSFSDTGLRALLENCLTLECLDLQGCWSITLKETTILEARAKLKEFRLPAGENRKCPRLAVG